MTRLHDEWYKNNQEILNSYLLVSQGDDQQDLSRKEPLHNHSAAAPPLRHPGSLQAEVGLSIRWISNPNHFDKAFISAIFSYHSCRKGLFFFFFHFLSCLEETEHTGLLSPREQTISSQELVNNHSCINWHQRTVTLSNKTVSKLEESIRGQLLRITGKVIIFHIIPSNFQTHGTEIQYSSTVNQLCITGPLNAFKLFKKCFPTAWYKLNQDVFTAV